MKRMCVITSLALGALPAAAAERVCMPADELDATLIDWYSETPVASGASSTRLLWASAETGTWTLVAYLPDGTACVIAQGDGWHGQGPGDQLMAELDG